MRHSLFIFSKQVTMAVFVAAIALTGLGNAEAESGRKTLYDQLGGKEAIAKVVHDMIINVAADNRINHFFANTNIPRLEQLLVEQICEATGGPCKYTGLDMRQAHKGMNIRESHFNALVENLQKAMDSNHVPLRLQNQLLAILAPMQPDVVKQ